MMQFAVIYFGLLFAAPLDAPRQSSEVIVNDLDQRLLSAEEIIVISDLSDPDSQTLTLQDFRINGEMVIPFFLDDLEFDSQIKGSGFEDRGVSIKTKFLTSILKGSEVFILNPAQPNPRRFTAIELIEMWGKK